MSNKYLKPMLDPGSPRVFNCNEMTKRIRAKDPEAKLFFGNAKMNDLVLIKDTIPDTDRRPGMPSVGTKLYFPFNEGNIYEGGRTIFLHDKQVQNAIVEFCGEGSVDAEVTAMDMRILSLLNSLPSLDPFLLKDVFLRQSIPMNEAYFELSPEAWNEIETFMLQKFEPLVRAAFPDIVAEDQKEASDDKARQLIDKIWEGRDIDALDPLINAFRLPREQALDIFSSWRGIVYYSYQYQCEQASLIGMVKWLKENENPVAGATATEVKEMKAYFAQVLEQLRTEWQKIEDIVRRYEDSYNKMFRDKITSADFLQFLRGSNQTYWTIGNCLGKANHALYCWDVMTSRFKERKLPWIQLQEVMKTLAKILEPEKKTTTTMNW